MAVLEKCSVCPGHPDKHFLEMAQCKKGELKSSDGKTKLLLLLLINMLQCMLVVKSMIVLLDALNGQLFSKTR